VGATPTDLFVSWKPGKARAGHRVAGYDVYLNGARVRKTRTTRSHLRWLRCGTVYAVGVRTFDSARRRSKDSTIVASTAACRSLPSVSNFAPVVATRTTITVSWGPSGEGVTGYALTVDGSSAATTSETSHTFSELSCGTAYTFGLQAFDATGARSPMQTVTASTGSCEPAVESVTTPSAPTLAATTTTVVGSDARVAESAPSSNYGSSSYIRVDGGSDPDVVSYLQFSVTGLEQAVQKATLRVFATSDTVDGPAVHPTMNTWTERGITWNTRPPVGAAAYDIGAVKDGTWVDWDVTALVTGSGTYSFALVGTSSDGLNLSSREGGSSPQLVLTTGADRGTLDTEPPAAPGALVVTGASDSTVSLSWAPATDNVAVVGYTVYRNGVKVQSTTETRYVASGLGCGNTYTFAVEAYDGAGNVSRQSTHTVSTASCPEVPNPAAVVCTKVASPLGSDSASGTAGSPFRTPQKLGASLAAGETGCLRGGTYTASGTYVLDLSRGGFTLRSYPGERARLVGIIQVKSTAARVTLSDLDFEGTGGANTVKVYAPDVVLERNSITNLGRGNSCLILGSNSGYGQAARAVVRRNRFHDCGSVANGNKDHGIYAQNVIDGQITDNVFWNSAAYAVQLYPNAQRTRFAHNVVDGDAPSVRGGVLFGGDGSYASSDNVVEDNVIAYAETYNITSTWSGPVGSGNVARANCLWAGTMGNVNTSKGGFTAYANTVADPLFLDRLHRDYRLAPTTACLGVVGYDAVAALSS
jgi:chitodextrinase